jgi:putative transposase
MKKSRFTEEQILFALKQGDAGQPIADVCRQMGISEATYYNWKKRYGNLGLLEVRELRQLRDENARLKRLVADLTLDRHVLQEVIKKKRSSHAQTPGHRTMDTRLLSAERTLRLRAELPAERHVVLPLASTRQQRSATAAARVGDRPTAIRLLTPTHPADAGGLADRSHRVHRLYKLEGLQVRMRVRPTSPRFQ